MIRIATLLAVLSGPALAQGAPTDQITTGYLACLTGNGDVELTETLLEAAGWVTSTDGEDGLIYYYPKDTDQTVVYMSDDGAFCHVESMVVDSATASEFLAVALQTEAGAPYDYSKDDMGCTRLDLETGVTATITSGGNDPTCGSDTDSAVRFEF